MPRLLRRATLRFGSKPRFGPGRSKGSTCSRSKAGVDGSAAMRVPGLMCCSTHRFATIRVSVRVNSLVSRIDQVRGTTSNSMVTGARKRMRQCVGSVRGDERAGAEKCRYGHYAGHGEPAPLLPTGDDQRDEQEDAWVLEAHGEADCDACYFEPARHEQRESDRDTQRQR